MQYEKSKRNNYTADFKREAVELVLSSGRNVPQIAAELGVSISNLRRWKREYQAQGNQAFPGPGSSSSGCSNSNSRTSFSSPSSSGS